MLVDCDVGCVGVFPCVACVACVCALTCEVCVCVLICVVSYKLARYKRNMSKPKTLNPKHIFTCPSVHTDVHCMD